MEIATLIHPAFKTLLTNTDGINRMNDENQSQHKEQSQRTHCSLVSRLFSTLGTRPEMMRDVLDPPNYCRVRVRSQLVRPTFYEIFLHVVIDVLFRLCPIYLAFGNYYLKLVSKTPATSQSRKATTNFAQETNRIFFLFRSIIFIIIL